MRAAANRLLPIIFICAISAQYAFALEETPTGTLVADSNDGAISYRIFDSDSNSVPDIEVTGATIGNGIYLDITSVNSSAASSPGLITLDVTGDSTTTVSALNSGTVSVPGFAEVDFSAINNLAGGAGNDTFTFNAALSGPVKGGDGDDTFNINASQSDQLAGGEGSDSFVIGDGVALSFAGIAIDGGADAAGDDVDTLDVSGAALGALAINLASSTANEGFAGTEPTVFTGAGGGFDSIDATIGNGDDTLFGLDVASNWTQTTYDDGTALLTFGGIGILASGSAADQFTFTAAFAGTAQGGAGNDTFNLNDGGSAGHIDGGAGNDVVTYAARSSAVTVGTGVFTSIESLVGSGQADTLQGTTDVDVFETTGTNSGTVAAIGFSSFENLDGLGGDDAFYLNAGLSGAVNGGSGIDFISGSAGDDEFLVNSQNAGTANGTSFANVETLSGSAGADTFVLNGGLDGLIDGGAGLDTILGSAQSNTFDVSSADSGTVSSASGTTAFANIENLTGGAAADMFLLNAGMSGLIDGGAGFDSLAGLAGPNSFVVTSLDAGTVNLIDFVNIENLVGGNDNDTFLFNAPLSGNAIGDGGSDFFDVSPDILVSIDGGAGTDEVIINGPNSNDLGLTNVENLAYVPEQVVYKVQGTVNVVAADLASDFSIGESFRLRYTFEPLAADTAPSADTGLYDAVIQAEVEVGSYSANLSPTGLRRITVYDNLNGIDRYRVDLSGVSGASAAGLPLADLFPIFHITDFTGVAFADDALPVTGLDLGAFGQNDFLALKFERPNQTNALVQASVDSFEVVPAFRDVPDSHWAATFVSIIAENGITAGCGLAKYCPDDEFTRAQMAVFLERGINGGNFVPPAASGNVFFDVGAGDFAANYIEQLSQDGITAGCGNNNFCPDDTVTRDQMAVFLLRAKYGSGYSPPAPTGVFGDVDLSNWAAAWIEQLAVEGITVGCGGGNYCPGAPVTRDQMAVFLVRTFGL